MKHQIIKNIIKLGVFATFFLALSSCREDIKLYGEEEYEKGLPATMILKISVPEMNVLSRAAGTDPQEANTVNNLWVGIFDTDSGEKTGEIVLYNSEDVAEANGNSGTITVQVPGKSGKAYIVAVANARDKSGMLAPKQESTIDSSDGPDSDVAPVAANDLLDKLQKVESWDEYNRMVTYLPNPTSISRQGVSSFVMSGSYSPTGVSAHTELDGTMTEVNIKQGNNTGFIHLRRLDAYNKVNIYPGDNISFEPLSWQIVNMPVLSYLHEHSIENGVSPNASDVYLDLTEEIYSGNYPLAYVDSEEFGPMLFDNGTDNSYSFDFYLRENKHTGIITTEQEESNYYNYREKEFKTVNEAREDNSTSNTGWYSSLVESQGSKIPAEPSSKPGELNNNASYLVINAKLSYWYKPEYDGDNKLIKATPVPENYEGAIYRTATVKFTVHLGYCENKEKGNPTLATANDFNCRRNTLYNYDIYVDGVDNIRLEAQSESNEWQPGIEGVVTDLTGATEVILDSHYGVVNIKLSDKDRKELVWQIQAPYDNTVNTLEGGYGKESNDLHDNQFYNWIQIRPTSGEYIIAEYPGDPRLINTSVDNEGLIKDYARVENNVAINKEGIWYLDALCDPDNFPHTDWKYGDDENTERWYTLFIDENVYDRDKPGDWDKYINANDRVLWLLRGNAAVSQDTESIYYTSIYVITQESIQSYYSTSRTANGENTGIGLESLNESYIYTKDGDDPGPWTFLGETDTNDARLNDYKVQTADGYAFQWKYASDKEWNEIYKRSEDDNHNLFFRQGLKNKENESITNNPDRFYIPEHVNQVMASCLSRNRDLNNNGKIDIDEMRWYLPSDGTYVRMMLGYSALRNPLFDAKTYEPDAMKAGSGKPYSHYASSNYRKLWAEELAATGWYFSKNAEKAATLRCVRNFGIKTGLTPEDGDYKTPQQAYVHVPEENAIELRYYRASGLRDYTTDPIMPHSVIDRLSYASRKFQYAVNDCMHEGAQRNLSPAYDQQNNELKQLQQTGGYFLITRGGLKDQKNVLEKNWSKSLQANSICKYYYEKADMSDVGTWRVPNITELSIIFLLGQEIDTPILNDNGANGYISCTYEYFNTRYNYYMGVTFPNMNITANVLTPAVRCVKDLPADY